MDHFLTIYKSQYEKKRVGNDFDGGYIICDISCNYDILLSGGIGGNISFENDFVCVCVLIG
jgi:hypothetical protein